MTAAAIVIAVLAGALAARVHRDVTKPLPRDFIRKL